MTKETLYLCQQLHAITNDITLLTLAPEDEPFISYTPGQFVEAIFNDGIVLPLSIANTPKPDGELEFHIRHNEEHPYAQDFLTSLRKEKKVLLRGPFGMSTLARANDAPKIVFVAGGTGFTPIKALLEAALCQLGLKTKIELYWGIRKPEDAYKLSLLQEWKQCFAHFSFDLVLSEPEHFPEWTGKKGFVHEYVAGIYPNFDKEVVFASGPYSMIKAAFSLFGQQGLSKRQFISDMLSA